MNEVLVREELWRLLESCSGDEVAGLRAALAEGRIEGCVYWTENVSSLRYVGGCGCVFGTVAYQRLLSELEESDPDQIEIRQCAMDLVIEFGPNEIEGFAQPIHAGYIPDLDADPRTGPYRAGMLMRGIDEWAGQRSAVA